MKQNHKIMKKLQFSKIEIMEVMQFEIYGTFKILRQFNLLVVVQFVNQLMESGGFGAVNEVGMIKIEKELNDLKGNEFVLLAFTLLQLISHYAYSEECACVYSFGGKIYLSLTILKLVIIERKDATFFQTAYINFILYMDDFNKSHKYDLRDTQISDSNSLAESRLGKQQDYSQEITQTNIFYHCESYNNKNEPNQNSIIHEYQYFETKDHQVKTRFSEQNSTPFKLFQTPLSIGSISQKIIFQTDINLDINRPQQHKINQSRNNSHPIQHLNQPQCGSQEQNEQIYFVSRQILEDPAQSQNDSQDSEQLFSQKISLIRGLEMKLESLHEKLKIQPTSIFNDYFNDYKVNLQRQYENHQYSLVDCLTEKPSFINQMKVYSQSQNGQSLNQKFSSGMISQNKISNEAIYIDVINQSIESEQLLIDQDFRDYERFEHTVRSNHGGKLNETSLNSEQAYRNQSESLKQRQHKIIQIVRIVQVPYLVIRENDDKIQSKKSFYFEQNEELHNTFQEFTERQNSTHIIHKVHTKIGQAAHRVQISEQNNESGRLQINQDLSCQNMINERSLLSLDSSNKTFHKMIKQRVDEISFSNEPEHEILLKQFTRCDQKLSKQLEQKLKCLQLQNLELKHKLSQFSTQIEGLQSQNVNLWQQLKISEEQKTIIQEKLLDYKQKVQSLNHNFAEAFHAQKNQMRRQYEGQLQQYEIQQSEYASRIIYFEQVFQQNKEKHKKLTDQIESRNQKIQQLQQHLRQRCNQVEKQVENRNQVERIIVQRQNQLKLVIENVQKQNTDLRNLISRFEQRYEQQGFYILSEQAEQLKKTIQQKDLDHLDQLQKVQNRYNVLISKYQTELQFAKLGLQKVRLNKSTSVSLSSNISYHSARVNQLTPKKRSSIQNTRISNSIGISTSLENSIKSQVQVQKLSQLRLRHAQSIENSQNEQILQNSAHQLKIKFANKKVSLNKQSCLDNEEKLQNLFLHQIDYLNEQNNRNIKLLQRQRQEKQVLSKRLFQISSSMAKSLNEVHDSQIQCEKNEQVFQKCVEQLEKQYIINQKLKNKLLQYEETVICCEPNAKAKIVSKQLSKEAIKVHPIYIQLSKKYNKSIKYAKILETQLKQLTSLPEFRLEGGKCCKDKEETISRLKSLFSLS